MKTHTNSKQQSDSTASGIIARKSTLLVITCFLFFLLTSCSSSQSLFQQDNVVQDDALLLRQYFSPQQPVLKAGDKITVSVWGHEELSIGSVNSAFNSNENSGRWLILDKDGEANLPKIGRIKLAGYNSKEVSYLLEEAYGAILQNPIINVRVLSHHVTILGEARTPGRYQLNSELVNLIQLLGQAGGLSEYAEVENIKVIRETENGPVTLLVDLTKLLSIPDYNVVLQPDDLIYIEANKVKQTDETLRRATPIVGILTGLGVITSLFVK